MKKDPIFFLSHIFESIEMIESYIKNITEKEFSTAYNLQDSVVRRVEIIGEAVGKLPSSFKQKHKDVPWRTIKDMRNLLIHEYFQVNIKIVWNTAKYDLPKLKSQIGELIEENKQERMKL